jgi:hypothetical protein
MKSADFLGVNKKHTYEFAQNNIAFQFNSDTFSNTRISNF